MQIRIHDPGAKKVPQHIPDSSSSFLFFLGADEGYAVRYEFHRAFLLFGTEYGCSAFKLRLL